MVEMTLNSSGIRDKAHVLRISPLTGLKVLKKESALPSVNKAALDTLTSAATEVLGAWGEAAEVDEMWSFVGKKKAPRWLWHALDHRTGKVLTYVFGRREDQAFLEWKTLLVPCGITRFYTDG